MIGKPVQCLACIPCRHHVVAVFGQQYFRQLTSKFIVIDN